MIFIRYRYLENKVEHDETLTIGQFSHWIKEVPDYVYIKVACITDMNKTFPALKIIKIRIDEQVVVYPNKVRITQYGRLQYLNPESVINTVGEFRNKVGKCSQEQTLVIASPVMADIRYYTSDVWRVKIGKEVVIYPVRMKQFVSNGFVTVRRN